MNLGLRDSTFNRDDCIKTSLVTSSPEIRFYTLGKLGISCGGRIRGRRGLLQIVFLNLTQALDHQIG